MRDEILIEQLLQKGQEAKAKAKNNFDQLDSEQLNWKPAPANWSIAQCLEHLVISDRLYFPLLEQIANGAYQKSTWEKISPLTKTWGRLMKKHLQEEVKRKMRAPGKFNPSASEIGEDILQRYLQNLDLFLLYISGCKNTDLDETIVTSPALSLVTYSLRDALIFLLQHEHRHLNQALRVMNNDKFPSRHS